ncbi:MAG TPA: transcription elongation factor GreA [Candidatus Paceibacterota bacterium]
MAQQKYYLSQDKYDEFVSELEELCTVKRKEIADALEYARSLGDISENAEFQEAREAQATLEERIATLKGIIKTAEIIIDHHSTQVEPGSTVTVKKEGSDKQVFHLVGSPEASYTEGRISNESPLGKAMMGKKKGENFEVSTPKGKVSYAIVEIA